MPAILGEYCLRPNNSNTYYVPGEMPLLLYTSLRPEGARTYQPRARHSEPCERAAALGTCRCNIAALKGRNKNLNRMLVYSFALSGLTRQSESLPRAALRGFRHSALPWADILLPLSGRKTRYTNLCTTTRTMPSGYGEDRPSAKTLHSFDQDAQLQNAPARDCMCSFSCAVLSRSRVLKLRVLVARV